VEDSRYAVAAEAAARHYYGISAAQLSAEQASRLAAMLPRPRYYDLNRGSTYLAKRAQVIQARMRQVEAP
jgi:monofunctional biosynthetic peptidoglycan transglycosylase